MMGSRCVSRPSVVRSTSTIPALPDRSSRPVRGDGHAARRGRAAACGGRAPHLPVLLDVDRQRRRGRPRGGAPAHSPRRRWPLRADSDGRCDDQQQLSDCCRRRRRVSTRTKGSGPTAPTAGPEPGERRRSPAPVVHPDMLCRRDCRVLSSRNADLCDHWRSAGSAHWRRARGHYFTPDRHPSSRVRAPEWRRARAGPRPPEEEDDRECVEW
jgi:hypothetical protein